MFPLAFPAFSCGVLVGFPSWLAMFVVPVCWLARFAARPSAVSCGCMRSHVCTLFMPLSIWRVSSCVLASPFFSAGFFGCFLQFFVTMVNNLVPRSTFHSLAADFIPSSSSQSTFTLTADLAVILLSVANVSQVATSAASITVVSPSTATPLFSPDALTAAVAQAIQNTMLAIVSALQSSNS